MLYTLCQKVSEVARVFVISILYHIPQIGKRIDIPFLCEFFKSWNQKPIIIQSLLSHDCSLSFNSKFICIHHQDL